MSDKTKTIPFPEKPDKSLHDTIQKQIQEEYDNVTYDRDRANRHGAILLGLIEDNRSEFDRRRDEAEYLKEQDRINQLIEDVLNMLGKE